MEEAAVRTIILHYHLFKNAGTSLDRILQQNFPDRWVTREFPGQNNTAEVVHWIQDNPEAVAFSSHTMMGPLPEIEGVRIISVMLLRDPIARIRSAYRFERRQQSDNFGAVLARHTDFEGYVRVRLSMPQDRQCRNFQTFRLASLVPGKEPELKRARAALERLSVAGLVETFGVFLSDLERTVKGAFPEFESGEEMRANVSLPDPNRLAESLDFAKLLEAANTADLELTAELNEDSGVNT